MVLCPVEMYAPCGQRLEMLLMDGPKKPRQPRSHVRRLDVFMCLKDILSGNYVKHAAPLTSASACAFLF